MATTFNGLFPQIVSFQNLMLAAKKAQKGKRFEEAVAKFNFGLEKELWQLQEELLNKTYQPGAYTTFQIYEPKPRMISAAPYRDRVVHHALCNIVAPLLEKGMIDDTYANRKGKGTHKAVLRYQALSRQYDYCLKCDVKKYFPSIDHDILKTIIRRKIACQDTLWLVDLILDNSNPQEPHLAYFPGDDLFSPLNRRRGLPIGNLTSQLLGNYYLNGLDHYVKDELGVKGYVRYVDDFVILGHSPSDLNFHLALVKVFLEKYRLILHPNKCNIYRTDKGIPFLGHRVFPAFKLLRSENVRRARKRIGILKKNVEKGQMGFGEYWNRYQSWRGHAKFSNTFRLRIKLWHDNYPDLRRPEATVNEPGLAWRFLEQQQ